MQHWLVIMDMMGQTLVVIGMQTVISIRKKCFCFVFLAIPFLIFGCSSSNSGKQSAYEIRDQLKAEINIDATKSTSLQNQPSTNSNDNQKKAVNAKGANVVNAGDTINYMGFSLQIEDIQLGDTIYDVSNIMSKDEADEYCKWLLSGESTWIVQQDGTFNVRDEQLAFVKCKIKNNNNSLTRIHMVPTFMELKMVNGAMYRLLLFHTQENMSRIMIRDMELPSNRIMHLSRGKILRPFL